MDSESSVSRDSSDSEDTNSNVSEETNSDSTISCQGESCNHGLFTTNGGTIIFQSAQYEDITANRNAVIINQTNAGVNTVRISSVTTNMNHAGQVPSDSHQNLLDNNKTANENNNPDNSLPDGKDDNPPSTSQ